MDPSLLLGALRAVWRPGALTLFGMPGDGTAGSGRRIRLVSDVEAVQGNGEGQDNIIDRQRQLRELSAR